MRILLVCILICLLYLGDMYFGKPKGAKKNCIPYVIGGIAIYWISIADDTGINIIELLFHFVGLLN